MSKDRVIYQLDCLGLDPSAGVMQWSGSVKRHGQNHVSLGTANYSTHYYRALALVGDADYYVESEGGNVCFVCTGAELRRWQRETERKMKEEVMGENDHDPEPIRPHQGDYAPGAWREYTAEELRWWVALLTKRAAHRVDPAKRDKDLHDASNYQAMLDALEKEKL